MVSAYLTRGSGPVLEVDAPYVYTVAPDEVLPVYYTVRDIEWYTMDENRNGIDDIKNAVMTTGAVSTGIYWSSSFYSGGNFYQPPTSTAQPNHSVCIAGWDDTHATQAPNPGAWLCKNSWGSTWNGDGYFWVSYDDKHAGRHPEMGAVSFHSVVADVPAATYGYDEHGWCNELSSTYAFNAYTAERSEHLSAVGFYTTTDNVDYDVRVYDRFEGGTLTRLLSTKVGTLGFTGFHTVDLPGLVDLKEGNDFYVCVGLSSGEQAIECTVDKDVLMGDDSPGYTVISEAHPGESFFSTDGAMWSDLYDQDNSANFCIKAMTVSLTPGDANGDHVIDGVDLATWQENFDPLGLNDNNVFSMGDWDWDGDIDGADLALWQENYDPLGVLSSDIAATVPEPATWTLLLLASGCAAAALRRHRLRG